MLKEYIKIKKSFSELAKERFSCRTFDGKGVEKEKLEIIREAINSSNRKFKNFRAGIVNKDKLKAKKFFTTGTYGMFKGDRYYVVGILKLEEKFDWVKYGFFMENIIIYLTELGLNTCWIGGVFDRKGFGGEIGLKRGEIVPAIIPFGYCGKRRTLRDKIVRWSARGDKRKPFEKLFFIKEKPILSSEESIKKILENVRIAPSASNKQPWRIFIYENRAEFFLKRDKLYSKLIPFADLQMIDMGIAAYHFHKSAFEFNLKGKWIRDKNHNPAENLTYIVSFFFN